MNIGEWKSQVKRGTLELGVLLLLNQKPSYGYEIISTLEKYPILSAKENTIYPLLRRMQKDEFIAASWQETVEGLPPRKYYSVTEKGKDHIASMLTEWKKLVQTVEELKGE